MLPEAIQHALDAMQTELAILASLQLFFIPAQQRRRASNTLFVILWQTTDKHDFMEYLCANKYLFPRDYEIYLYQCLRFMAQFDYEADRLAVKSALASTVIKEEIETGTLKADCSSTRRLFFTYHAPNERTIAADIDLIDTPTFERLIAEHPLNLIPSDAQAVAIRQAASEYLDALVDYQAFAIEFNSMCLQFRQANQNTIMKLHDLKEFSLGGSLIRYFTNEQHPRAREFLGIYAAYAQCLDDFASAARSFHLHQISDVYDRDAVASRQEATSSSNMVKEKLRS